jgi:type IV secretory pathway VirB3-like protein
MHNAESILVIITSTALTLFLIAGIIVMVLIAKLLNAVRRIVQKAEQVVETAGDAAQMLRNASGPLAFFKVVRNIIQTVDKMHKS